MTLTSASGLADRHVCEATGFELVRFPPLGVWRVYDNTYHPVSTKPHGTDTAEHWSRFDLEHEETVYGATKRAGAFAECLAPLRPRLSQLNALAERELTDGMEDFRSIDLELTARGMVPTWIDANWRFQHGVAQVGATRSEWFVDVDSLHTIGALRSRAADLLDSHGYEDLDVALLRSGDRRLTTDLAELISWEVLDDGSTPSGIRFESRHGSNLECWAVWGRGRPKLLHATPEVLADDEDFCEVLAAFGLKCR